MNIELGQARDGNLLIASDAPLPAQVRYVEYYRSQRLFMLVYEDSSHEGDLMHYELGDEVARKVERAPSIMVIVSGGGTDGTAMMAYSVPLIQIGI